MLGYWWGVLGVIMVPQSDLPPKPLGATVPQSSLFRWKWAPKLKPLPLHSSKALDSYFWAQSFLGVDKLNHKKKSKILENRLNRLVNYIRLMVLNTVMAKTTERELASGWIWNEGFALRILTNELHMQDWHDFLALWYSVQQHRFLL